jgi:hypothetical protein
VNLEDAVAEEQRHLLGRLNVKWSVAQKVFIRAVALGTKVVDEN